MRYSTAWRPRASRTSRDELLNTSLDNPEVKVVIVIGPFEKEDFEVLRKQLEPRFLVSGGVAYDFSETEAARVVVELVMTTLQAMPTTLLTSVLYDALKALVRKAKGASLKKTTLEFKIISEERNQVRVGRKYVHAQLETADEEVLKKGLETLKELAKPEFQNESFELKSEIYQWKKRKQY